MGIMEVYMVPKDGVFQGHTSPGSGDEAELQNVSGLIPFGLERAPMRKVGSVLFQAVPDKNLSQNVIEETANWRADQRRDVN
jgi:hypothetical protein